MKLPVWAIVLIAFLGTAGIGCAVFLVFFKKRFPRTIHVNSTDFFINGQSSLAVFDRTIIRKSKPLTLLVRSGTLILHPTIHPQVIISLRPCETLWSLWVKRLTGRDICVIVEDVGLFSGVQQCTLTKSKGQMICSQHQVDLWGAVGPDFFQGSFDLVFR